MTSIAAVQTLDHPQRGFAEPNRQPLDKEFAAWVFVLALSNSLGPLYRRHVCYAPRWAARELAARIMDVTAEEAEITMAQLKGQARARHIAWPRQVAMWLMRRHTDLSCPQIARKFGRDHTTALHAFRAVDNRRTECEQTRNLIERVSGRLGL